MEELFYDALIIGFGKAGKTLAVKLAQAGKKVALAEMDSGMYGGTCINVGCIPSKSLIVNASGAPKASEQRAAYYCNAIEEKRRLTSMLRKKNYDKLNNIPNITVLNGKAHFISPAQAEVVCKEETYLISAKQFFINTGSMPRIPAIEGIESTNGVYTSATLMELEKLPERLIIIGGGYIGLEFASMFAAFGSHVTVIQDSAVFLPREDEDIAAEIRYTLEAQGVVFCLGEKPVKISDGPSVLLQKEDQMRSIMGDAVLVATGRVPNISGLNCEAAGVALTPHGAIQVDELLRTTAPHIWAMGDVTGGLQHTYVSLDDSRIVWQQLTGGKVRTTTERNNVPYSVYLRTPYSRVGMNEREARAAGYRVKTSTLPVASIPKAQVLNATQGVMKAVIDEDSGKILGAMLLCAESHEIVNIIKFVMDMRSEYTVLRDQIFTHPTMAEALNDLFSI